MHTCAFTHSNPSPSDIQTFLARKLVGQPAAIAAIVPYIQMYRASLSPAGRPAGIFLLLGPTGTGKTKTVEALAEVLHGTPKKLLKIDCGEFQLEHEVAKLIGAPPGYLGHRETQPALSQQKINAVASESSDLSIVLFDEIEKAAPSMVRLLLGVLDKGTLRLGDNTQANFERSVIFLTSNLGAKEMSRAVHPEFGLEALVADAGEGAGAKLDRIGSNAVRRCFPPEFLNRIDAVVTYHPLDEKAMNAILDQQVREFQEHLDRRLGDRTFEVEVPQRARRFLLERGISVEYGARELKRTLLRQLVQPLASLVAAGEIAPGAHIRADLDRKKDHLVLIETDGAEEALLPAC